MEINISSENELPKLAQEILDFAKDIKVFTFQGELGTGKTTLIKQICKLLGVKDDTSSPTYSIVNEYHTTTNKVYHLDLYRLNSLEEAFEVGLEDYLESENYCFIEWPDVAAQILPDNYIQISLSKMTENTRICKIELL